MPHKSPVNSVSIAERIAQTLRPVGERVVMRQAWDDLLFLHWPVDPEAVQNLLPPGLTVDTFEGKAYIGLVPFAMRGVRPVWAPSVPGLSAFLEVNVRTYVHREGKEPGVWFFSLDATNPIAVALARGLWHLPYFRAKMSLVSAEAGQKTYLSKRLNGEAGCAVTYKPAGNIIRAEPGTLLFFLAERYRLYAYRGQRLWSGRVWHHSYPLQSAQVLHLSDSLVAASGFPGVSESSHTGPIAHFSAGVNVEIFPLQAVSP